MIPKQEYIEKSKMGKIKILIIENDESLAKNLKNSLKTFGHQVVEVVNDCEKAISFIKETKEVPDLILLGNDLESERSGLIIHLYDQGFDISVGFISSLMNGENIFSLFKENSDIDKIKLESPSDLNEKREAELIKLKKANEMANMQIEELMQTQQHLITATWRERELKEELSKTKSLVEEKNKKILDSINYAKRIQKAIIPKSNELKEALEDYFMFYKPKDTVSGDFPWLFVRNNFVYIAAVDCTGHGVPGAMMSLIGFLLLNNVMGNNEEPLPSQILNELHREVVNTLRQNDEENKASDGMDVAICRIDRSSGEVMYSGAHRPLY